MLYLTTRNKTDSYTAHRVLNSDGPVGGGFFVPFQLPIFSQDALMELQNLTFNETLAKILNLFFGSELNGWDVEFAIGRQAIKLVHMSHRIFVLETWRNPKGDRNYMVSRLHQRMSREKAEKKPGLWFYTVLDIAILFATFGQLLRRGISQFNVAIPGGDLQMLVAIRYGQKMGLPVAVTAVGSAEKEDLWELIYHGNYSTKRESLPSGLEQLIYLVAGVDGVNQYLQTVKQQGTFRFTPEQLRVFACDLFSSVVGNNRMESIVTNVKSSCDYSISRDAACAYGALQDCRVRAAGGLDAVLFSNIKPEGI